MNINKSEIYIWSFGILTYFFYDLISTIHLINTYGIEYEINILVKFIYQYTGSLGLISLKIFIMLFAILIWLFTKNEINQKIKDKKLIVKYTPYMIPLIISMYGILVIVFNTGPLISSL